MVQVEVQMNVILTESAKNLKLYVTSTKRQLIKVYTSTKIKLITIATVNQQEQKQAILETRSEAV